MFRVLLAAIAALLATACASLPPADEARAGVTTLIQRWSDAGEAGDWDGVAATYADAPGFTWIEQGEARYTDHAAIVAGLAQARWMQARIQNDVSDIVVTPLSSNAATYRATYVLIISAEGFSVNSTGTLSGVAVRSDGVWRFLQGSFSERPAARN